MSKPNSINIENELVYLADDLYKYDQAFFPGCNRMRLIIEKKKLKDNEYFFAYMKDNKWKKSTSNYPKAKLYLKEEWVVKSVPKMMDSIKLDLYKYEEAPPILELENEEKFKDKDGNIIEIEVRGEREYNKCYFKVKDISNGFKMPNLNSTIMHKDKNYELNIHYKTFSVIKMTKEQLQTSKNYLFLTYNGILKVLFSSRSGNAESFQNWATEKLFTIQLGTVEQKDKLASSLIGVNHQTIKDVFKTNSSKTPCVYLYLIGKADTLLEGKYDKDDLLCKFGCTDDLPRRCSEHDKLFSKEFNVKIELLCFSIIEAQYIFQAESNITQYFKSNQIEYNKMKELIIINKKDLPQIKQHYCMIQNSYIGRYEEMHNKISFLEKEIIELNNKILLKDRDIELLIEKHKNEIKDKDIKLLQCKLNFYESHK
jgi:hypothetical protein